MTCTATLFDVPSFGSTRDVTSEATWLLSDPSIGSFVKPGVFMPTAQGEAGLWARYDQWEVEPKSWFLVGPGRPARWLHWLAGFVKDAATDAAISGAEVRVLDGYAKDARAITNANGYYQIEKILTEEMFSVTASKERFAPSTKSYRVDPPVGPNGNSPFLDFQLTPLQ